MSIHVEAMHLTPLVETYIHAHTRGKCNVAIQAMASYY